ncbi:isocitrate/isopropylmalate dehydrogenase [Aaosphaeria arxii CBS 175.79]|uniref:Isocitrate/isopropylmalate dehydrogenase n=1 Tax=Aaosphaeria arxii CBS 175.79 TaxID=1450172 RepID=A0A6A5Y3R9_9PLEO|nr:isocitrate/isopropylmalate dehydrogenase [Aaosphaeria arxii CBS 175.79]KAF2019919.1 isocitrate/isopropylmalate dehydrogenase [Aaosphaeria arxii CBS 175.79]
MTDSSRHVYRIASIPGDGIGIEVTEAALEVLKAAVQKSGKYTIEATHIPWGTAFYKETGSYLPDDFRSTLKSYDAILFGAVGAPDVPDHISLWELLLKMRGPMQLYANVRPIRCFTKPRLDAEPAHLDWLLVRENSEGEYSGHGGRSHVDQNWEVATDTNVYTRHGIRRIMKFAFEAASKRPRKHLTVVSKSNALRYGLVLWDEVAKETAKDFPDVTWDKELVDAMTIRMVQKPWTIDTVVGTNLHIDILSDLAAALAGSIGIAPSANLDPERQNPSLFEPVHGSAFDIMGKGIANPIGAIWAAANMLEWLGEQESADAILNAIAHVCNEKKVTADMGGDLNTKQAAAAICEQLLK